jgi:formylglycine-generating enzyme required for sulfatase activity/tRNA A-37 threonylcarbamoyl transferase component Bud32
MNTLSTGNVLQSDKYTIEQVIGSGGFGITYLARHNILGHHYAVKEFFISGYCVRNTQNKTVQLQGIDNSTYDKYRQKFIEEAQILASLNHPNIVKVTDIFRENNTAYIVMPYIQGQTLQQTVEQGGRLQYETAVNYIAQIAEAVDYIHQRNILHRDIKPENIIITPENKAMLIDFGSAREFVQDKTKSHTSILTPGYAPLEQYSSIGKKGSYTDIYALGATFYFALTGQKPMDAATRSIGNNMPEPNSYITSIPDEANRTIMKAMELKPENRQQQVEEFMDDLLNKTIPPPIPKQPMAKPTPTPPKQKTQKTAKGEWIFCIVAVFAVFIGIVYWQNEVAAERERAQQEQAESTRLANEEAEKTRAACNSHITKGDAFVAQGEDSYKQAMKEYEAAIEINEQNNLGITSVYTKKAALSKKIDGLVKDYKDRADQFIELLGAEGRNDAIVLLEKALRLRQDKSVEDKLKQLERDEQQRQEAAANVGIQMVLVRGGTFTMGCTSEQGSDCDSDETPTHSVTVNDFYIGKYEVTQAQWQAVMGSNPSYFKGDNLPVETVSWNDVQEFIRKLNAQTGKTYRLPTEAEWEYAARGGAQSRGYRYSGSNTVGNVAWYSGNSGNTTHPAGQKLPNELGLYDMSGNVWEWCSDRYGAYSSSSQTNPSGPSSGSYRVFRGGCWNYDAQSARVPFRNYFAPDFRYDILGFRLASSSK